MSAGIIYNNGVALTATAAGTSGQVLTSQGSGSPPIWGAGGGGGSSSVYFMASLSTTQNNVTGTGGNFNPVFDTVIINNGSGYNGSTGIFTAPFTGLYLFAFNTFLNNISTTLNTYIIGAIYNITTASDSLRFEANAATINAVTDAGNFSWPVSGGTYLTAGDQIQVVVAVGGSSATVNCNGDPTPITAFTGFFVGSNPITAKFNYTSVNTGMSSYTVLLTDQYIGVDCSGGVVNLLFPDAPSAGQYWTIKDVTGSSATNNITITTVSGTDTFDNATIVTLLQNYGSLTVLFNGTSYEVS